MAEPTNAHVTEDELNAYTDEYCDAHPEDPTDELKAGTWRPSTPVEVAYALRELATLVGQIDITARVAFDALSEVINGLKDVKHLRAQRIELIDEEGTVHATLTATAADGPTITTRSDPRIIEHDMTANLRVVTGGDYGAIGSISQRVADIEDLLRIFGVAHADLEGQQHGLRVLAEPGWSGRTAREREMEAPGIDGAGQ